MEIAQPLRSFVHLKQYWENQNFINTNGSQSLPEDVFNFPKLMFSMGDYFSYAFDCLHSRYSFVGLEIKEVLGYDPFMYKRYGLALLDEIIHPDDKLAVLELHGKAWRYLLRQAPEARKNITMSIDYRIRRADRVYIRMLQQNCVLQTDDAENITKVYGICTDISHWCKKKEIVLTLSREGHATTFRVATNKSKINDISNREKEIIREICNGKKTTEISDSLHISPHTVNTHRKVIMRKLGLKGTASLVRYATDHQLV